MNRIITLALTVAALVLAAILLTQRWLWLKRLWRTVLFAPLVIPVALAGLIFDFLLNSRGALNDVLISLGILQRPLDFLGNPDTALLTIILISVWQIFGQYMIYWMAALQNVPESLYEAAAIDGANEWHKLRYITLPVIRPVATIILFLSFVNALKVFGLVAATTEGGPGQSTYVVSYFIYNQAFRDLPFRYGYASAAAVLFGVTVLLARRHGRYKLLYLNRLHGISKLESSPFDRPVSRMPNWSSWRRPTISLTPATRCGRPMSRR